jgi:protoporphyrinogen oxidase
MTKKNIAIIGAGLGSAFVAHKLKEKYNVTVFEKTNRLGGDIDYRVINNKQYSISALFINIFLSFDM